MSSRHRSLTIALFALALLLPALPAAAADDGEGYGYFRVLEGSATLVQGNVQGDAGNRAPVEINQPVLTGDRVLVARSARLEVVLPDGTLLRIDGGSDLTFDRLAGSPDSNDAATRLQLAEGEMQVVVPQDFDGEEPRIDTANATFYLRGEGSYRISFANGDWSSLLVRDAGSAEVVTRRGSLVVRADEEATVEGEGWGQARVDTASATDGLERWARRLDQEAEALAQNEQLNDLDGDLRYQAAPLANAGSWIDYEGRAYWRPRVDSGWRPFWHGRWYYTPSGLTWVPYEPWGWVTSHYGSWDYLPGWGWAWQSGYAYSPAWVYWYWGPSYVGWCPAGYYTRFYGRQHWGHGLRFGVYGWAGGDWGAFADWTFVPATYVHHRDLDRWARRGRDFRGRRDETDPGGLERGLITTDTTPVDPSRVTDPQERLRLLRQQRGRGGDGDLPDVTPFIARRTDLPPRVMQNVVAEGPGTQVLDPTAGRGTRYKPADGGGSRAGDTDGREGRPGRRPAIEGPERSGRGAEVGGLIEPQRPGRLKPRAEETPQADSGRDQREAWRDRNSRTRRGDAEGEVQPVQVERPERPDQPVRRPRVETEKPRRAPESRPADPPADRPADTPEVRRETKPRGEVRERRDQDVEPRRSVETERPPREAAPAEPAERQVDREQLREQLRQEIARRRAQQEQERERRNEASGEPPARRVSRGVETAAPVPPAARPDLGPREDPGRTERAPGEDSGRPQPRPGESWRPRPVESAPRVSLPPAAGRSADRPRYSAPSRPEPPSYRAPERAPQRAPERAPQVATPPSPRQPERSAPAARPAPPQRPRDEGRGGNGREHNRPRGGGD